MNTTRAALMSRMPIFQGIRQDTIEFLLGECQVRRVATGDFFFRQGEDALFMYVLEMGRVTIRKNWHDREFVLGTIGEGECFGEMALIEMVARGASVRAERVCSAIEISSAHLYSIYEYDPAQFTIIQINISRELCRRLRMTDDHLIRAWASQLLPPSEWTLSDTLSM